MAAALPFVTLGASALGTVLSASGQAQLGQAAVVAAKRRRAEAGFEADQLEQDAGQSVAASQRAASDTLRQTKMVNSTALARAAASGAGASDPTVEKVMGTIAGQGAYKAGVALYEGEAQSRLDRLRATALRYGGDIGIADAEAAAAAAKRGAVATLLTGGANTGALYSKYFAAPRSSG